MKKLHSEELSRREDVVFYLKLKNGMYVHKASKREVSFKDTEVSAIKFDARNAFDMEELRDCYSYLLDAGFSVDIIEKKFTDTLSRVVVQFVGKVEKVDHEEECEVEEVSYEPKLNNPFDI